MSERPKKQSNDDGRPAEDEPLPDNSPFYSLPNVYLSPHVAGASKQTAERQGLLIADVEEMAHLAPRDKRAILDLPGLLVHLRRFPAVERLAVAEGSEAGFSFRRHEPGRSGDKYGE